MKISYDCEELIEEIKKDINEFGENHIVYAMYENVNGFIFLTNYDFINDEKPLTDEEKEEYDEIKQMSLSEILKVLEEQNSIF